MIVLVSRETVPELGIEAFIKKGKALHSGGGGWGGVDGLVNWKKPPKMLSYEPHDPS